MAKFKTKKKRPVTDANMSKDNKGKNVNKEKNIKKVSKDNKEKNFNKNNVNSKIDNLKNGKLVSKAAKSNFKKKSKNKFRNNTKANNDDESKEEDDDLETHVKALGGDEEDLRLMADTDKKSTESDEFSAQARNELEEFIKKLGLDQKWIRQEQLIKEGPNDQDIEVIDLSEEKEDDDKPKDNGKLKENKEKDNDTQAKPSKKTKIKAKSKENDNVEEDNNGEPSKSHIFSFLKSTRNRNFCLIKSNLAMSFKQDEEETQSNKWYSGQIHFERDTKNSTNAYWLSKLKSYASKLFRHETELYANRESKRGNSEQQWMSTVLKQGTMQDRLAAKQILVQQSPLHNLLALDNLIEMVSLKRRRPCMLAMALLTELFGEHLLVSDRKLISFDDRNFSQLHNLKDQDEIDRQILLWHFESELKVRFGQFVENVGEVAKDSIDKSKFEALKTFATLLKQNPEKEQELLQRIVNKLGDPVRRVAARAMHELNSVVHEHPGMKSEMVAEVERLLYRSGIAPKAQYYAICFLSRLVLDAESDVGLASNLIELYFGFFKACVKKGDVESKMLSAILTGVNRAFPFAKIDGEKMEQQLKIIFRIVHMASFNISIQALMLIYQALDFDSGPQHRFFAALYRKLPDLALISTSKQAQILNLVFKSMRRDPNIKRVRAFTKRLLQIASVVSAGLSCALLMLISEVIKERRSDLGPDFLLTVAKESEIGNLDKFDGEDEDICVDVDEENELPMNKPNHKVQSKWVHRSNLNSASNASQETFRHVYDPFHRDPRFSGSELALPYELALLSKHSHPTVNLFARTLIDKQNINYSGDPLRDFNIVHFLDRFVFRNPKKEVQKSDSGSNVHGKRDKYSTSKNRMAPNTKSYVQRAERNVPVDEKFIYDFMKERREQRHVDEQDSDADSVSSQQFNDILDGMSKVKKKKKKKKSDKIGEMESDDEVEGIDDPDLDEEPDFGEEEFDEESFVNSDNDDDDNLEFDEEKFVNSDNDMLDEDKFDNSDDNDDNFDISATTKKSKKKKTKKSNNLFDLLASAEDFADELDKEVDDVNFGSSEAVANPGNSSAKQLKWESHRDVELGSMKRGFNKAFNKANYKRAKKNDKNGFKKGIKRRRT